jgi:hypothetical protein
MLLAFSNLTRETSKPVVVTLTLPLLRERRRSMRKGVSECNTLNVFVSITKGTNHPMKN